MNRADRNKLANKPISPAHQAADEALRDAVAVFGSVAPEFVRLASAIRAKWLADMEDLRDEFRQGFEKVAWGFQQRDTQNVDMRAAIGHLQRRVLSDDLEDSSPFIDDETIN